MKKSPEEIISDKEYIISENEQRRIELQNYINLKNKSTLLIQQYNLLSKNNDIDQKIIWKNIVNECCGKNNFGTFVSLYN